MQTINFSVASSPLPLQSARTPKKVQPAESPQGRHVKAKVQANDGTAGHC